MLLCLTLWVARPGRRASTCSELESSSRTGLILMVQHFRGSTGILGALMSSPEVTTTCSARYWQCEEGRIKDDEGKPLQRAEPYKLLNATARYFDLSRRVLLLAKLGGSFLMQRDVRLAEYLVESGGPLPPVYGAGDVLAVRPVVLLLYFPPCLRVLSSHYTSQNTTSLRGKADDVDIAFLEGIVASKRRFDQVGVPNVVVSYADILWNPTAATRRLESAVPCLGPIDFDYRPKFGVDVFLENEWKPAGTVAEFAKSHDPKDCCDYDLQMGACAGSYWQANPPQGHISVDRAFAALRHLQRWSREPPGGASRA